MDLEIRPDQSFNTQPFIIKIAYNETVENLIYTLSLSLVNVPVTEIVPYFKGKKLTPLSSKLNEFGISQEGFIEIRRKSSNCCCVML